MDNNIHFRKKSFSPLGIGTWGIGGFATKDPHNDDNRQIEAMVYALKNGLNYVELNMWSAEGYSAYLFAQALKKSGVAREKIFINFAGYPYNAANLKEANLLLTKFLAMINSDHVDSYTLVIGSFAKYGKEELINYARGLLTQGRTSYIGFTNGNLAMVSEMKSLFKEKFFSHELNVNFEIRVNEDLGITDFASHNNILNVVYQPLRRNRTAQRNWPLLAELAAKYRKTQNQIILNWLHSMNYLLLVKTENIAHIDEDLKSFDFVLEPEDLSRLNKFYPEGWVCPQIDWERKGDGTLATKGVYVDQLSNIFDSSYDKLTSTNS